LFIERSNQKLVFNYIYGTDLYKVKQNQNGKWVVHSGRRNSPRRARA